MSLLLVAKRGGIEVSKYNTEATWQTVIMMRFAINPAYFLGVALSLSFPGYGVSQPSSSAKVVAPRIRFEGDFDHLGRNTYIGAAASLAYESARSHQVRSVQWTHKWLDGTYAPAIPRSITFDLYEIKDFAACAALEPLTHATYTSEAGRKDFAPKLFDVRNFDHELIQGHCVAVKQATEVLASHIVRVGGGNQIAVVSGDREWKFFAGDHYELLSALGISVVATGHDLWSRDGMKRSLDPLSDEDLIRAINASAPLRLASLRILQQRLEERFTTRECGLAHSPLLKPTGPAVVRAILDNKTLSEGDSELRLQTMRALAAAGPAANHQELIEQLLSGLEQPIEDRRPPAELERQRRVEVLIGKEAAAAPEGQATYRDYRHFEVAAGLALLSGNDVQDALAMRFREYLTDKVLGNGPEQPCTNELVAESSYGANATMELIRKVDTERFVTPLIQLRIQNMAAIAAPKSPSFKAMIAERCGRAEGFLPNGDRKQALAFCRDSTR